MKQVHIITKTIITVLILSFSSAAYAHGSSRTSSNNSGSSFSFSFQINGLNGNSSNIGHYDTNRNGVQYYHYAPPHNVVQKPKPYYKLTSKKLLVRSLRKMGYRNVQNIRLNGRYYTAHSISPRGHKVWVKVNRRNGYIAEQKVLSWNVYNR